MIKFLKNKLSSIDKTIKILVKQGSIFCLNILFIATIILFTYECFYSSPTLFLVGLLVFRIGIIYLCTFWACGFAFSEIKNEV